MGVYVIIPCARCDHPMRPIRVEGAHDRPAIRVLRCPNCGTQERPEIETALTSGAPSQQLIDAIGFNERESVH